ncbi:MAG: hypothetical protein GY724_14770 [Actinomycetia bacterium]|nr:hypothetical protein [Actinomycetes bacterium]MCP4228319.1 hypothetical protein [Actinomycetes bacterium]MCP5030747.1 hypothetical protein [Actinomycetes bacterium]
MGEPVAVRETPSSRPAFVRFETNRSFTGMGHERYASGDTIHGDRPPDRLAEALFGTGQVDEVHIYGQAITVKLSEDARSDGLRELIEDLYVHYRPGVEVPTAESFATGS